MWVALLLWVPVAAAAETGADAVEPEAAEAIALEDVPAEAESTVASLTRLRPTQDSAALEQTRREVDGLRQQIDEALV